MNTEPTLIPREEYSPSRVSESRQVWAKKLKQLGSDLKKTNSLLKKLRRPCEANYDQIHQAVLSVNLSRFLDEIAVALCDAKPCSATEIAVFVQTLDLFHFRYPTITERVLKHLYETFEEGAEVESTVHLLAALFEKGISWEFEGLGFMIVKLTEVPCSKAHMKRTLPLIYAFVRHLPSIFQHKSSLIRMPDGYDCPDQRGKLCIEDRIVDYLIEVLKVLSAMGTAGDLDEDLSHSVSSIFNIAKTRKGLTRSLDDLELRLEEILQFNNKISNEMVIDECTDIPWENVEEENFYTNYTNLFHSFNGSKNEDCIKSRLPGNSAEISLSSICEKRDVDALDKWLISYGPHIVVHDKKKFNDEFLRYENISINSVPFWGRALATFATICKEFSDNIVRTVLSTMSAVVTSKDQGDSQKHVICAHYLGELCKFELCDVISILQIFEKCLKNFFGVNVRICCALASNCGLYLSVHPLSKNQFRRIVGIIRQLRNVKNLGHASNLMIDTVCYKMFQPNIRSGEKCPPPLVTCTRKLLFSAPSATSQVHKLPWSDNPWVCHNIVKLALKWKNGSDEWMSWFSGILQKYKSTCPTIEAHLNDELFEEYSNCTNGRSVINMQSVVFLGRLAHALLRRELLKTNVLLVYITQIMLHAGLEEWEQIKRFGVHSIDGKNCKLSALALFLRTAIVGLTCAEQTPPLRRQTENIMFSVSSFFEGHVQRGVLNDLMFAYLKHNIPEVFSHMKSATLKCQSVTLVPKGSGGSSGEVVEKNKNLQSSDTQENINHFNELLSSLIGT